MSEIVLDLAIYVVIFALLIGAFMRLRLDG